MRDNSSELKKEEERRRTQLAQQEEQSRRRAQELTRQERELKRAQEETTLLKQKLKIEFSNRESAPSVVVAPLSIDPIVANEKETPHCAICLDSFPTVLMEPCGHLCLCTGCLETLATSEKNRDSCPICRAPVQTKRKLFIS